MSAQSRDDSLHDADEMENEDSTYITVTDEDGSEQTFELLQVIDLDGQQYGVLAAVEEGQDEQEDEGGGKTGPDEDDQSDIIVLRMGLEGDEQYFEEIDDEEEFQRVVAVLEQMAREDDNIGRSASRS